MDEKNKETKLCKYCQTEIPKKAKICPNCRKKQGGKLKWIIIVIVVILLLAMLFGGGGDDEDTTTVDNTTQAENQSNAGGSSEQQGKSEEEDGIISVGGTFEVDGLQVSVDDANLDFADYEDELDMYTPADGTKYIAVSFTFNNSGDSDKYVSIYDFTCYADDTNCEQAYLPDGSDFMNTNLSSGRNVSFTTYYTVPEDAQSIELEYTENVWTDDKITIQLK